MNATDRLNAALDAKLAEYAGHVPPDECNAEAWDGNRDDPSYAYCDLPPGHAGPHRYEP